MRTVVSRLQNPEELAQYRAGLRERASRVQRVVRVCCGPGCIPRGSKEVYDRFVEAVEKSEPQAVRVETRFTGCQGMCERAPLVTVDPGGVLYQGVQEEDVPEIWRESVLGGRVVERLLYRDHEGDKPARTAEDIPFYRGHRRIALALCGVVDARSIDDYIAAGGYAAVGKVLESMEPEEVIDQITRSGLRGRGGGGFPTGRKWRAARDAQGEPKYLIANGDEGDPGAFMDRALMEGVPHAVIEGMMIGAYAIGSAHGYIYVRNEYPIAVERLQAAIEQARQLGLLGQNILSRGFDFDIRINRGAGAFVCGEESGLIASLEGRVGEPRPKYILPVEKGLLGKPSVINNVETLANIPPIILKGAEWFASLGTEKSKGTKIFSLVGNVENTGLVEVPMGMTLRQIIYQIGGGIRGGKAFKAVQTGGPSGGCIPAECLDEPVDFDRLTELGSMMGSGGMIVMDEDTCMVSVAKYFLEFLKEESCGKCTPCREGIAQMLDILWRITGGQGRDGDMEALETLGELLQDASLCALGKTAANPALSTVRRFRNEYEEHIHQKHCPAKVCPGLFRYEIDDGVCSGCGVCAKKCPVDGIAGEKKQPHVIDQVTCTHCGTCFEICPFSAIVKI